MMNLVDLWFGLNSITHSIILNQVYVMQGPHTIDIMRKDIFKCYIIERVR